MKHTLLLTALAFASFRSSAQTLFPENKNVYGGAVNLNTGYEDNSISDTRNDKNFNNRFYFDVSKGKMTTDNVLKGYTLSVSTLYNSNHSEYAGSSMISETKDHLYSVQISRFRTKFHPVGKQGFQLLYRIYYGVGVGYQQTKNKVTNNGTPLGEAKSESFGENVHAGISGGIAYKLNDKFILFTSMSFLNTTLNTSHRKDYFKVNMSASSGLNSSNSLAFGLYWCPGANKK
ncbi:MAG: hypothetical protein WC150_08530 [Bacteroidia bacterium]